MWDDKRVVDPRFVALAKFLFSYAYGLPGRAKEGQQQREPLVFASTSGYVNWDPRHPAAAAIDARSKAMNESKDQELRMQALEAAKPDEMIIDVKKGDTEVDGETLESVNPDTFNPGGGKR